MTARLCTCGRQFQDWTAAYRLFSRKRFDPAAAFTVIRRDLLTVAARSAALRRHG